jgi:sugar lactone lactonase YvrE
VTVDPLRRVAGGFGLLEAARWYPQFGLLFSDMTQGGVFALRPDGDEPTVVVPHRKGIGGLVAHADGGLVLAGRNVAHKMPGDPAAPTTVLLETAPDEQFFNDLTADGQGRLYVGSVGRDPAPGSGTARPDGRLYRIDLDGTVTVLADDVLVSNGLGTDPAGERLYHVDSNRRLVWVFPIGDDAAAGVPVGSPGPVDRRTVFVDTSEYAGVPDGLTVAADGSVWVAMAGGSVVVVWDSKGARVAEIPVPQSLVTSVTFGGPGLRTLFVFTGHNHEHPDPAGGCLYRTPAEVPGLPGAIARLPLPMPFRPDRGVA